MSDKRFVGIEGLDEIRTRFHGPKGRNAYYGVTVMDKKGRPLKPYTKYDTLEDALQGILELMDC